MLCKNECGGGTATSSSVPPAEIDFHPLQPNGSAYDVVSDL